MKETEKNFVPYVTCSVRGKPVNLPPDDAVRQLYVMVLTDDLG
jgi:type I restriction enzyme M protein